MTLIERIESWWDMDEAKCCCPKRWALALFKRIYIIIDQFVNNNISSYVSALTYTTMLAVVPILAIIFAIARGFGFDSMIEGRIHSTLDPFSPELAEMVLHFVENYLQHTQSGVFLGVGILLLFYTLVNLTLNIETAFDIVWQANNTRSLYRRITNYLSVFLLLPILMIITNGVSVLLLTLEVWFEQYFAIGETFHLIVLLLPFFISSLVFVLLYKLMPNTRVRWSACLLPGVLAGLLFQGLEFFYLHYQIKLSSYNAIYGSFAAIPMLLIFIQFTWYICLIGCQMSYANQMVNEYNFEHKTKGMSRRFRDTLSILLVRRVAQAAEEGGRPMSRYELARETHMSETLVKQLLEELLKVGILGITYINSNQKRYILAMNVQELTVRKIMESLDSMGSKGTPPAAWMLQNPEWKRIQYYRNNPSKDVSIMEI